MCARFVGQVVEPRTEGERTGEARGRWAPRRPARPGSTLRSSWGLDIGWELNGAVFTAAPRGGRCAIELECDRLGIKDINSRPYHPQTCGKVERFHQTEKKWLAKQDPAATVEELQAQLDTFRV
jgi:transposase InsO family protein